MSLVTSGRDQRLRVLADAGAWHRALGLYPWFAHLGEGEPITGVTAMGGTDSRRRRLVVDGRPLVTGIVQIGDAWGTINPQFGTGITMGWRHAAALRDALRETGTGDPLRLALVLDTVTEENLTPVWESFAAWDRNRLAEIEPRRRATSGPPTTPTGTCRSPWGPLAGRTPTSCAASPTWVVCSPAPRRPW